MVREVPAETGGARSEESAEAGDASPANEPSAVPAPFAIGVAEDGIVAGAGGGSEELQGFKDNTEIFRVISENL